MQSLQLDMIQYDCPYIRTTLDHDVTFYTQHCEFRHDRRALESRMLVTGQSNEALTKALKQLKNEENLEDMAVMGKKAGAAQIHSRIDETEAMHTILDNNGYVTGPFVIENGSELWNIGFDWPDDADGALSELDRNNEFDVEAQTSIDITDYHEIMQNLESIRDVLSGLWNLTDRERETLLAAVEAGYFETPRGATLGELADEFGISKNAVSKNLRRSQRKVLDQLTTLADEAEDGPESKGISSFDDLVSGLER